MKTSKTREAIRADSSLRGRGGKRCGNGVLTRILLGLVILTSGLGIGARGGVPSGSFQYALTAQDGVPLWNFTGPYALPYGSAQLHQDGNGKIVASYDALGVGSVGLAGRINGGDANLKMRLQSAASVPELVTDGESDFWLDSVKRKDKFSLTFDATSGSLAGTDRVSRTREEVVFGSPNSFWPSDKTYLRRTASVSVDAVALIVPESTDGNWTLTLTIVPTGDKLSGTAAIAFSSGEVFHFQLQGRYSPKTGRTTLLLRGSGTDKGASLTLLISGAEMGIESMRGVVGGQRIRFPQLGS
jgi:hypothetical protein